MQTPGGQQRWEWFVGQLDTPPVTVRRDDAPPEVERPSALPPGAPVGPQQEAAALDAFMGARR